MYPIASIALLVLPCFAVLFRICRGDYRSAMLLA
jgi:hypothetical protein